MKVVEEVSKEASSISSNSTRSTWQMLNPVQRLLSEITRIRKAVEQVATFLEEMPKLREEVAALNERVDTLVEQTSVLPDVKDLTGSMDKKLERMVPAVESLDRRLQPPWRRKSPDTAEAA